MALATVCPHCKTTFRVAADQLKLRGGIVRCGTCREIFDGNASLVDLDAPPPKGIAAIPDSIPDPEIASPGPEDDMAPETIFAFEAEPEPAEPKPEPEAPSASAAFDEQIAAIEAATPIKLPPGYVLDFDLSEPVSDPVSETSLEAELEDERDDDGHGDNAAPAPSLELSVADDGELSSDEPEDWPCPDELEKPAAEHDLYFGPLPLVRPSVIAPDEGPVSELPAPEPRKVHPEPEADEPEFVRLHREKEQAARRRRLTMGAGSVLLMLVLLAQGVSIFRNVLAARYPALTPALAASCKLLRCKIELPAQIETMVLDTGELQSLGANKFQLTTLLRNEGTLTQAWPYLELELTDAADKALVRRVFTPAQFLPASVAPAKGFAGRSEQQVKIVFELKQLKASGFHIAVFYP